jgi:hypothetical protein
MAFHAMTMENFARLRARWRPPRPWRSPEESEAVQRFVLLWLTCMDRNKPSGRSWARQLGISHTWLQRLTRRFAADPVKAMEIERLGYPTQLHLETARQISLDLRVRGELRSKRRVW